MIITPPRKLLDYELQEAVADMVATLDTYAHRKALHKVFALMGFDGFYLLTPVTLDRRFGRALWSSGLPDKWLALYEAGLSQDDPMPDVAMQKGKPFRWSDTLDHIKLTAEEKRFFKKAAEHGLSDGLAVPVYGPGGRAGFVGLTLPRKDTVMADDRLPVIQGLAQLAFTHYCELIGATQMVQIKLSQRELDVIYWIAKGKSNVVIAEILDISAETVDSYVRRVFKKLDVSDRTSAVLSAVAQGHIYVGYHMPGAEKSS